MTHGGDGGKVGDDVFDGGMKTGQQTCFTFAIGGSLLQLVEVAEFSPLDRWRRQKRYFLFRRHGWWVFYICSETPWF